VARADPSASVGSVHDYLAGSTSGSQEADRREWGLTGKKSPAQS
jgi:hypothetical protein